MGKYIAFLRGINISGKNKISMSELKFAFEEMEFMNVRTFLNSGNICFETEEDKTSMKSNIERMISDRFGFDIPVYIIEKENLERIINNAPNWWGTADKDKYDNLIFILSEHTPEELIDMIGETSEGIETIQVFENAIFWTFDRKSYQKCNWWKKTAGAGIAELLTIRTASTVKKVCGL